jgi:hypothetical protein
MAARLPVRFLRAHFGPTAKDQRCCHCARAHEPARHCCRRLALALALALFVVALVVVHSRFTYVC